MTRYQITSTRQVDLDESLAAADSLASLEDTGHVAERVWQVLQPVFSQSIASMILYNQITYEKLLMTCVVEAFLRPNPKLRLGGGVGGQKS